MWWVTVFQARVRSGDSKSDWCDARGCDEIEWAMQNHAMRTYEKKKKKQRLMYTL